MNETLVWVFGGMILKEKPKNWGGIPPPVLLLPPQIPRRMLRD